MALRIPLDALPSRRFDMGGVLLTIRWPGPAPDPASVQARFGIAPGEMDARFGVVLIDPADDLYSIQLTPEAAERVSSKWARASGSKVQGPYSNPVIEPFGTPSASTDPPNRSRRKPRSHPDS